MQGYKIFCARITPGGACNVNTVITDSIVISSTFFPSSPKQKNDPNTSIKFGPSHKLNSVRPYQLHCKEFINK